MPRKPGMKFAEDLPEKDGGASVAAKEGESGVQLGVRRFDWRKEGYRILVAPQGSYSISVSFWEENPTASGGTVREPRSRPLSMRVLTGGELDMLGYGDLDLPDIPDPAASGDFRHELHGKFYHELPEITKGTHVDDPQIPKRIPLYGCQLRIDEKVAEEFGGLFRKDEEKSHFEALVEALLSRKKPFSLYGRKYAFLDDEEGMAKLMPRFAQLARDGAWSKEDVNEVFRMGPEHSKVGPRLSEVEPHRFEKHPKTGRAW